MSPDDVRTFWLPIHGAVGVGALLGGLGAIAAPKGSRTHRWAGRLFVVAMAAAIAAAIPVLVATRNLFLTGMGGFAAYMCWTGWRVGRSKTHAGSLLDRGVSAFGLLLGLVFGSFGVRALAAGSALGLVPVAMGVGWAAFARSHLIWYAEAAESRTSWQRIHAGAIGGGFIAGLTAFAAATVTNWVPMVPEPIVWLLPPALLIPVLRRETARLGPAAGAPPRTS